MEFRILGPLEVTDGERVIEVKAPKQRLMLTVLALADGSEVSSERLLRELWGEEPPGGGLKTLQYHVSKLRDTLQPDRESGADSVVVTHPNGYALAVPPDGVDAARFERIVQDARRLLGVRSIAGRGSAARGARSVAGSAADRTPRTCR